MKTLVVRTLSWDASVFGEWFSVKGRLVVLPLVEKKG